MKPTKKLLTAILLGGILMPLAPQADEGNWKRGRIYYRMVCTACHTEQPVGSISPASMTIAEWKSYLDTDQHAKGTDKVSYYFSTAYRESVKDSNKAAAKFLKMPEEALKADVRAFVIHGAKDSDNPARCN